MLLAILALLAALIIAAFPPTNYVKKPWGSSDDICTRVNEMGRSTNGLIALYLEPGHKVVPDPEAILTLFQQSKLTPCWLTAKISLHYVIDVSQGEDHIYINVSTKADGKWLLNVESDWYVAEASEWEALVEKTRT